MTHTNLPLWSPRVVALHFDVKPTTVVRWCREGKIKAVKVGRVWRIPEDEVVRLQRAGL